MALIRTNAYFDLLVMVEDAILGSYDHSGYDFFLGNLKRYSPVSSREDIQFAAIYPIFYYRLTIRCIIFVLVVVMEMVLALWRCWTSCFEPVIIIMDISMEMSLLYV